MTARKRREQRVGIGVDVGGTWVRAVSVDGERARLVARASASRVPELRSFLLTLGCGPRLGAAVVAARGVWTAAERRALRGRLSGVARIVRVISDAEAALLGALGDEPGILVLAGTGSIVLGRDGRGRWARAGGLGPLLGDEGSAFWLGRDWLRERARRGDFLTARRIARAPDAARRIAAIAPQVVQRAHDGDRTARAIVRDGQRHLATLALRVIEALCLASPVGVSWAGSLMDDPRYRRGVARALTDAGVRTRWIAPRMAPVEAAARLAWRLATDGRRRRGMTSPERAPAPGAASSRPGGGRLPRR
jgi:N-acetylglucosamine kinase-like BadF-type ATPase